MTNPTQLQLMQAAVFFSAGIALGLVYDFCRAIRRCSGHMVQTAADVLFVSLTAVVLFVLSMLVGGGQLRIFMVGCVCGGGAVYSRLCSEYVVPLLCGGLRKIKAVVRFARIPWEKTKNFIKSRKNLFPKRMIWSKINGYNFNMRQFGFKHTRKGKDAENNRETDGMDDLHHHRSHGNIRRVEYGSSADQPASGRGVSHRADRENRSSDR